jgi:predicted permease
MRVLERIRLRFRSLFHKDRVENELDDEIRFHLEELIEEEIALGVPSSEARNSALRKLGGIAQFQEQCRDLRGVTFVEDALRDLHYAARTLRRSPGFTIVALLSLTFGIGANTGVFTLINVAMLKPLPVRHPEELVFLQHDAGNTKSPAAFRQAQWEELRNRQDFFSSFAAYSSTGSADLSNGGQARPIAVGLVSGSFFSTLGVGAVRGRLLGDADDHRGCAGVAVITHGFWQSEYSGRDVIGSTVGINGRPFEIVGVAESDFFGVEFGYYVPVWMPQCAGAILRGPSYEGGGILIGRRKPGVTIEEVRGRLVALAPGVLEATMPANISGDAVPRYRETRFDVLPFEKGLPGLSVDFGQSFRALMALTAVVLLIACANLANLLLARAAARRHEIAVRLALGARRARIIRQLLTESLLLASVGAAAGVVFAIWSSRTLLGMLLRTNQLTTIDFSPDLHVLAFTAAASIFTGLLFGLAPAVGLSGVDPKSAIMLRGHGMTGGFSGVRAAKVFVALQTALSMMLIAGTGLLLGSWHRLQGINPGFRSKGVLLATVNLAPAHVEQQSVRGTYERILDTLAALPGVQSASAVARTPIGHSSMNMEVEIPSSKLQGIAQLNEISEGYFEAIGAPIFSGRGFTRRDVIGSPRIVVVNREFVRRFLAGGNAVGSSFRLGGSLVAIAGVAGNTKDLSLTETDEPIVYVALRQDARPENTFSFALRVQGSPAGFTSTVSDAIMKVDPRLSLDIRTLQRQVDDSLRLPHILATLSSFFGTLALLLASIGVYGVVSYAVARRRNEIGIRIALGAQSSQIVGMLLVEMGRVVIAGVAAGMIGSIVVTGAASKFLYGTSNGETTVLLAALLLTAVAAGAAFVPARRASLVDLMVAVRCE